MGGTPGALPTSERDLAIASAVHAAASAAEAKAAAEWDEAETRRRAEAKLAARKIADEAAHAVDAQIRVCEEADAAVRRARLQLEELERAKQQAHMGLPNLESGIAARWNKGFGFIVPRDVRGGDLFCHCSDILDGIRLQEGATVRFIRVFDERKQKFKAIEVTGGVLDAGSSDGQTVGGDASFDGHADGHVGPDSAEGAGDVSRDDDLTGKASKTGGTKRRKEAA